MRARLSSLYEISLNDHLVTWLCLRERTKEVYPRNVIALSELASIGHTGILSIMTFAQ
jgi:hypothetical protein